MVFLGTVTEALATEDGRITRARMRVDQAYKGVSEKSLVLFDDGWCDGPNLEIGEQYLMYTRRLQNGDVPSRGCTRSRHVKYAGEDLKYLRGLSEAPPVGTVFGKVITRTDYYSSKAEPVSRATVKLSDPERTYSAASDNEGRYEFRNVEPGSYTVTSEQTGFRMLSFARDGNPPSTSVEARGCAVVNLVMRRTWSGTIQGRLIPANGAPAPVGIDVTLIQRQDRDGEEEWHPLFDRDATTNDQGEYSFPEVEPGRYKIVMNLYRFPTGQVPYPTIYWPAARSESEAHAIEITDVVVRQRFDFRLPPEPKGVVVNGIVLSPDGKPAPGARVFIVALPENAITGDDTNRPETDAAGRFAFTAFEGIEYRLNAHTDGERWQHSADLRFSLAKEPPFITLVLDRRSSRRR